MSSHGVHRLGLLYAAIPVLAAAYDGYEVSTQASKQHHPIDLVTIFMPRLVLGLIVAFVVYGFFRAVGSILMRLHGVALAAQPTHHIEAIRAMTEAIGGSRLRHG